MIDNHVSGYFEETPPPRSTPIDPLAKSLGLVDGLRAIYSTGGWRCAICDKWQNPGSIEVWVPDGLNKSSERRLFTEMSRLYANNGYFSAWCMKCAPRIVPSASLLSRIKARILG